MSTTITSKRKNVFDAIDTLENQDAEGNRKKMKLIEREQRQANAAKSQIKIFGLLMELRILMQRVLQGGTRNNQMESAEEKSDLCNAVLLQLLRARNSLSETELSKQQYTSSDLVDSTIAKEYDAIKVEWKEVFNKRYKDLRLHSGLTAKAHFKILDSDFWQQVESITSHDLSSRNDENDEFDDSKCYQHMLQDFLLGRSKENSMEATRRPKSNKSSKDVDRRASKGRKIRYAVIPKLVNFTFPQQRGESALDEEEWFKSLFGGRQKISNGVHHSELEHVDS